MGDITIATVVPETYFGMHFYVDSFLTIVSSKQISFHFFWSFPLLQLNFTPISNKCFFHNFKFDFKTVVSMTRKMKIVNSPYEWTLSWLNKLNNFSRDTFHVLKYFDKFLSNSKLSTYFWIIHCKNGKNRFILIFCCPVNSLSHYFFYFIRPIFIIGKWI